MADILLEVPQLTEHPQTLVVEAEKLHADTISLKDIDLDVDNQQPQEGGAADLEEGGKSDPDYPDGGLRAWLIVVAAVCVMASTFGVVSSWVRYLLHHCIYL